MVNRGSKNRDRNQGLDLEEIRGILKDSKSEDQIYLTDIDHGRSSHQVLVFRKLPLTQWAIGTLVFSFGIVFLWYLAEGHTRQEGFFGMQYNEKRHLKIKWYHFLTSLIIVILGVLFIVFGKIRIVEFNKEERLVKKITK